MPILNKYYDNTNNVSLLYQYICMCEHFTIHINTSLILTIKYHIAFPIAKFHNLFTKQISTYILQRVFS